MKQLTLATVTALATLFGTGLRAAPPVASSPAWSFGISFPTAEDSDRLRDDVKNLAPLIGPFAKIPVFKDIAWVRAIGFDHAKTSHPEVWVHLHLRDESSVDELVQKFDRTPGHAREEIAGLSVLRRESPLSKKIRGATYLAFPAPHHIVICTNRAAVERLAATPAPTYLTGPEKGEIFSARLYSPVLEAVGKESELLGMIRSELGIKIMEGPDILRLEGMAEMADARTANRARRLLEGLVTALALELETDGADPLDERLILSVEGNKLTAHLRLTKKEVKAMLKSIGDELKAELSARLEK